MNGFFAGRSFDGMTGDADLTGSSPRAGERGRNLYANAKGRVSWSKEEESKGKIRRDMCTHIVHFTTTIRTIRSLTFYSFTLSLFHTLSCDHLQDPPHSPHIHMSHLYAHITWVSGGKCALGSEHTSPYNPCTTQDNCTKSVKVGDHK